MQSTLIVIVVLVATFYLIKLLHKIQQQKTRDTVERSAPLPPLAIEPISSQLAAELSDTPAQSPLHTAPLSWPDTLKKIKESRDAGKLDDALTLCQSGYPRLQAFQQALIIYRVLIKQKLEHNQSAEEVTRHLYNTAVIADFFRSTNPLRPASFPAELLPAMMSHEFPYSQIGFDMLKLLNKSDIRYLQQLWGEPEQHAHSDAVFQLDQLAQS